MSPVTVSGCCLQRVREKRPPGGLPELRKCIEKPRGGQSSQSRELGQREFHRERTPESSIRTSGVPWLLYLSPSQHRGVKKLLETRAKVSKRTRGNNVQSSHRARNSSCSRQPNGKYHNLQALVRVLKSFAPVEGHNQPQIKHCPGPT